LFGGGLHQSVKGAVLNVHIDYNLHPKTKFHRRCNLIIFMNKNWQDKYEGHLELWDFVNHKNGRLIEKISPVFNRAVIFETNEVSFHGHPHKLNTPDGMNRKSIATYYYTKTRPESEVASEHNTVYKNVNGLNGGINRFKNGLKALFERIGK
jgi:Rps23 Pro-64 3,4-dihydroxylase Tpa1-like proline 4-hydroxylase